MFSGVPATKQRRGRPKAIRQYRPDRALPQIRKEIIGHLTDAGEGTMVVASNRHLM